MSGKKLPRPTAQERCPYCGIGEYGKDVPCMKCEDEIRGKKEVSIFDFLGEEEPIDC